MKPFFEYVDYEQANLTALANETDSSVAIVMTPMANAMEVDSDGWALLAPYGDHPHARGIQRFTKEAGEALVSHFKSWGSRLKRAFVGVPIYRGHPDNRDFANVHTDKQEYGQVSGLEAREDGLYWKPTLNDAGAELVQQGFEFGSINWDCMPLANRVFQPMRALSVGLTDRPNIPGQSLANASSEDSPHNQNEKDTIMPPWLLELLGLPETASEDEVKAALAKMKEAAASQPSDAPAEMANELAANKAQIDTLKKKLDTVETTLANERRDNAIAAALQEGRITAAEKETWQKRLDRDFEAESKALANVAPAIDPTRRTAAIRPGAQTSNRQAEIDTVVRKRMKDTGEKWPTAFANCKADPEHSALFAH